MDSAYLTQESLFFNGQWGCFYTQKQGSYVVRVYHDGTIKANSVSGLGVWSWLHPVAGAEGELYAMSAYLGSWPIYPTFAITGSINSNLPKVADFTNKLYAYGNAFLVDVNNGVLVSVYYGGSFSLSYNRLVVMDIATETKIREVILDTSNIRFGSIAWAWANTAFCASSLTGQVRFVDYMTGTILADGAIDPFYAASYDSLLGCIVAIGTDYKMRIYATVSIAETLANPVASPSLAANQASLLTTRLTDGNGNGKPGVWVNWSLEAVGGGAVLGSLRDLIAVTDADGYAYNYWFGPVVGSGEVTVKCRVDL